MRALSCRAPDVVYLLNGAMLQILQLRDLSKETLLEGGHQQGRLSGRCRNGTDMGLYSSPPLLNGSVSRP
jgi:hypothetical protein